MIAAEPDRRTGDPLAMQVRYVKGVGPRRAAMLEAAGLRTVFDLLLAVPRRHFDRRALTPVAMLREGEPATVQGRVERVRERITRGRGMHLLEAWVNDGSGRIPVRFFNQRHLRRSIEEGATLLVAGVADGAYGLHFRPAEFEVLASEETEPIHARGLVPVYPLPSGIGIRGYRRLVWNALHEHAAAVPEILPAELRGKRGLASVERALHQIHFPESDEALREARTRLAYEELLLLQAHLAMQRVRTAAPDPSSRLRFSRTLDFRIRTVLPFPPTAAQERVIAEIRRDLESGRPMNRLLQGDVGSGKTLVAAYAVLGAVGNRRQAAILAPTEILAEQHHRTFRALLEHSRVRIGFLSGALRGRKREERLASVAAGEIDLVIGTHAVIGEAVRFRRLSLVVVDEQQKFGVLQRAALRRKGERPHVLVMTATPIPRTLALTLFGDLDVSVIDGLPPGRRPVRTVFKPVSRRADVLEFVRRKAKEGRQAYFVAPLVDESERLAARAVVEMHAELTRAYPEFRVGLLHGQMKAVEKDGVMESFRKGKTRILVSTIVVEVGIDVPNATVMVIDNAERYGLSQLHQLRGRIGRGTVESTCFVLSERKTERLRVFTATTDGFLIAEEDLRIRGPGEMTGTRQSGLPDFRVADLAADAKLLGWAREDAREWVERDPALGIPPGPAFRRRIRLFLAGRVPLSTVG